VQFTLQKRTCVYIGESVDEITETTLFNNYIAMLLYTHWWRGCISVLWVRLSLWRIQWIWTLMWL